MLCVCFYVCHILIYWCVLLNTLQSQRDAFNDTVPEKGIGVSFGGKETGSELPRNFGLGLGRASELGHGYKAGSDIVETISGQKNGFIINHGISNQEAPKSTGIRSNVMSTSWKNSEEEEFMWEDMNTGLTDPVASKVSSNLSKDFWTADDENLVRLLKGFEAFYDFIFIRLYLK